MSIEKKLMEEQHRRLRCLKEKLSETLDNEPLDSGDEDENETRTYRGKPWYVIGNPWVWVIEFERISR